MEDLNGEEIIWTFYKKELQKTKQKEFKIKKKFRENVITICHKESLW